jgi:hypothetical protein
MVFNDLLKWSLSSIKLTYSFFKLSILVVQWLLKLHNFKFSILFHYFNNLVCTTLILMDSNIITRPYNTRIMKFITNAQNNTCFKQTNFISTSLFIPNWNVQAHKKDHMFIITNYFTFLKSVVSINNIWALCCFALLVTKKG